MFQEMTTKDIAMEDNLMPYNLKPGYMKMNLGCVLKPCPAT